MSEAPPRVRCTEHGLVYDPAQSSGCVLCRRRELSRPPAEPAARSRAALFLSGLVLFALGAGALLWAHSASNGSNDLQVADSSEQAAAKAERSGALQVRNTAGRSGAFFVPSTVAGRRLPLLVLLHGTGSSGNDILAGFRALAEEFEFAVVAPDSRRAPNGEWTWEVGDRPDDETEDLRHILKCVQEVLQRFSDRIDARDALIAGYSGGGSSAPYVATRQEPFGSFAVLHGGVFPGGLGGRGVQGWFSTGSSDTLRPPDMVRAAAEQARARGLHVEYREFSGGHQLSDAERRSVVQWWSDGLRRAGR